MKKLLSLTLASVLAVALAGCGGDGEDDSTVALPGSMAGGQQGPSNPLAGLAPETVLVTVDQTPVTAGEINAALDMMLAQAAAQNGVAPGQMQGLRPLLVGQAIQNRVGQILLENALAGTDIAVSDEEIAAEFDTLPPEVLTQARARGIADETIQDNIRQALKLKKYLGVADATEEEVATFYRENPDQFAEPESIAVRHILIGYQGAQGSAATRTKEEAATLAAEIRAQAEAADADFSALARQYSECPSAAAGGMLGETVTKGQMVPAFEEAAFSLDTGVVSQVVETPFGYHLILVEDHTPEGTLTLEEVQDRLSDNLTLRKLQEALVKKMDELQGTAEIVYTPGFEPRAPKPPEPAPAPRAEDIPPEQEPQTSLPPAPQPQP
ncbi:MAG TPA: peptidylprolyl isomerase [bacterium]|nr:peptidylprolyl isomerase [bacterium]HPQ66075.1 peptidylprolyl isomerase [bacterium]